MASKEESSFLQEVESRLDSLFGEEAKPAHEQEPVVVPAAGEEHTAEIKLKDIEESPTLKIADSEAEVLLEPLQGQAQDKSAFVSEIEKRFTAIFGEDDKSAAVLKETAKPDEAEMALPAGPEASEASVQSAEDISLPPSSVLQSPLKDLKSIVLSLEWEINDRILEQLDDEVNKLYLLYTGDRILQGLLRIIRFVGRYVRVRKAGSNQDSIDLLMSVYDQLENVMVAEGMTEGKKHSSLMESIKKYRSWVESTDLESPIEPEPAEVKFSEEQKEETISFADVRIAEERPPVESGTAEIRMDAESLPEPAEVKFSEEQKEETISFADVRIAEERPPVESGTAEIRMDAESLPEPAEVKFSEEQKEETISFADVRITEERPPVESGTAEIRMDAESLPEPAEVKFSEEQKEETISFADVRITEERPPDKGTVDQTLDGVSALREEPVREAAAEFVTEEPEIPAKVERSPLDEMFMPEPVDDRQRMIAAMRNRPPEEAIAYALEEMKKTFQAEIDTLKEEIRRLKNAR